MDIRKAIFPQAKAVFKGSKLVYCQPYQAETPKYEINTNGYQITRSRVIDLGLKITNTDSVILTLSNASNNGNSLLGLGGWVSSNDRYDWRFFYSGSTAYFDCGYGSSTEGNRASMLADYTNKAEVLLSPTLFKVNNSERTVSNYDITTELNKTLQLGSQNEGLTFYELQIIGADGTIKHRIVPTTDNTLIDLIDKDYLIQL